MLLKIRGARGLGDAVYLYPIAKHFINQGKIVQVMTQYPVIYNTLNCICIERYKGQPDIECRYGPRYPNQETNLWEDTLIRAGLQGEKIEFSIEYICEHKFDFNTDKKLCLIKTPAYPHYNNNGITACLLPQLNVWQEIINTFKSRCYFIMAGLANSYEFNLMGIDRDMSDIDNIPKLMKLVDISDIVITPSSYFVSFAEALDKKVLIGFAQTGLDSMISFYRWCTPKKVITKPNTTSYFIDSDPLDDILSKFERLLNK